MSVELGSVWIDNDSDLLVIVKSLEAKCDGKVTVIFNYIVRTGDKSIESASELELFLNTKAKLARYTEKGDINNKDDQNLNYRAGFNDGWHDCEASFELGNDFTDSIKEQAYEKGYVEGYNQHEYEVHQVMPESSCKSLRELSEQEFESIIDEAFEEGYAQAYSEIQSKTERERALQEKAWDEGYSQAISDVIDEDFEDGYSEYEFGAVEDGEEEYCFSKELDRILKSGQEQYEADPSAPSMGNRYDENGKLCGFFINTGNEKIGGITANTKEDLVNNPSHYNSDPSGVKCIEITRHRNNNIGNVIKYVWRNGLKDGNSDIQDLEKAAWYLNDEIQRLKDIE